MPILQKQILSAFTLVVAASAAAQSPKPAITGFVVDAQTKQPLVGAVVRVSGASVSPTAVTDAQGRFAARAAAGVEADISYMGYATQRVKLSAGATYALLPKAHQLNSVVVTATESLGLTSASTIARHAMQHLQPSSFADILELLPGGYSRDPQLSSPSTIHLREVPISSSDYQTSALGTAFVIDGARISTNANMQYVAGATDSRALSRDFTDQGVDMRSLSTDDIERVEVVRGIPSVEYGDLTSGVVKITRRKGGHALSARFKADMNSKLFHVAKGLEWKPRQLALNVSADYLISRADPRNPLENYSRLTLSARLHKKSSLRRYQSAWSLNVDYGGSFDKDKVDPELNYGGVDRFSQQFNRFSSDASWTLTARKSERLWLKALDISAAFSLEADRTSRTRLVQLDRQTPASLAREDGEHDA
uniref:TonB-dependent receptor n=1 Tax=Alloprevotella sp. TaxID=1872471 RepID=UPI0040260129